MRLRLLKFNRFRILGHNKFSGTIPTTLGELENMHILYLNLPCNSYCFSGLNHNQLNGSIPSEIGCLSFTILFAKNTFSIHNEQRNLEANQLTGEVPSELLQQSISIWFYVLVVVFDNNSNVSLNCLDCGTTSDWCDCSLGNCGITEP